MQISSLRYEMTNKRADNSKDDCNDDGNEHGGAEDGLGGYFAAASRTVAARFRAVVRAAS